jgi:hypothetical protein
MLFMETFAAYSESCTEQMHSLDKKWNFFNFKACDMYDNFSVRRVRNEVQQHYMENGFLCVSICCNVDDAPCK